MGKSATTSDQLDVQTIIAEQMGMDECARCGNQHDALLWQRFTKPVVFPTMGRPTAVVAWAPCPTLSEPVLLTEGIHEAVQGYLMSAVDGVA